MSTPGRQNATNPKSLIEALLQLSQQPSPQQPSQQSPTQLSPVQQLHQQLAAYRARCLELEGDRAEKSAERRRQVAEIARLSTQQELNAAEKEQLQQQLQEYQDELESSTAELHVLQGAVQEALKAASGCEVRAIQRMPERLAAFSQRVRQQRASATAARKELKGVEKLLHSKLLN
mmetsp:Transcript_29217/g.75693  ORF Transcript_29217/g.75693 Transcript_29217/m.75693 type:complete len:176 (+) Transcript_29217:770-1297(+)|eukprot:1139408-Pelagomonas_calceolata.AAC.1